MGRAVRLSVIANRVGVGIGIGIAIEADFDTDTESDNGPEVIWKESTFSVGRGESGASLIRRSVYSGSTSSWPARRTNSFGEIFCAASR